MEDKPGRAAAALFEAYPPGVRLLGRVIAPLLERAIRSREGINPGSIVRAREAIVQAADRVEQETGGDPSRYLVGGSLTLADITAASLLAPIVAPPESPYARAPIGLPTGVLALRRELRGRAAGEWVMARYRNDRRSPRP